MVVGVVVDDDDDEEEEKEEEDDDGVVVAVVAVVDGVVAAAVVVVVVLVSGVAHSAHHQTVRMLIRVDQMWSMNQTAPISSRHHHLPRCLYH